MYLLIFSILQILLRKVPFMYCQANFDFNMIGTLVFLYLRYKHFYIVCICIKIQTYEIHFLLNFEYMTVCCVHLLPGVLT